MPVTGILKEDMRGWTSNMNSSLEQSNVALLSPGLVVRVSCGQRSYRVWRSTLLASAWLSGLLETVTTSTCLEEPTIVLDTTFTREERRVLKALLTKGQVVSSNTNIIKELGLPVQKELAQRSENNNSEVDKKKTTEKETAKNLNSIENNVEVKQEESSVQEVLDVGERVLVMSSELEEWKEGRVLEVRGNEESRRYKVSMVESKKRKVVTAEQVARNRRPRSRVARGARVAAIYRGDHPEARGAFYSGVIGEVPPRAGRRAHLVLFDDGFAAYLDQEDLRLVCAAPGRVWEGVHLHNRSFIKSFLEGKAGPLLELEVGQEVEVMVEDLWVRRVVAKVVDKVVKMEGREEWMFRGAPGLRLAKVKQEVEEAKVGEAEGSPSMVKKTGTKRKIEECGIKEVAGCSKRSNCQASLPVTCQYCGNEFSYTSLRKHIEEVHSDEDVEEKVQCGVCGITVVKVLLPHHLSLHH